MAKKTIFPPTPIAQIDKKYQKNWKSQKIEKRWQTVKIAGNSKYGCWPKEPTPFRKYPHIFKFFLKIFATQLQKQNPKSKFPPLIGDIGCGNGYGFVKGFFWLKKYCPLLKILLLDIQSWEKAVKYAHDTYCQNGKFKNDLLPIAKIDIGKKSIVHQILNQIKRTDGIDSFVCTATLHFLTGQKLKIATSNLHNLIKKGGYGLVSVCSIYNPACIGNEGNLQALQLVLKLTKNGQIKKPVAFFNYSIGTAMTFFTPNSLKNTLQSAGFKVCRLNGIRNPPGACRHNLGNKFPEFLFAIVRKN